MAEVRTAAGDRWRQMQDAARGQAQRLADPNWSASRDPYAGRVDSFRAGERTDHNIVEFVAGAAGPESIVLEVGAGAGRLCLPLAQLVREVVALEPSPTMADALESEASAQRLTNVRVVRSNLLEYSGASADAAFAAHVVHALPYIEEFVHLLQRLSKSWCAIILFAQPSQSQLASFWPAVFGETRLPNPALPQLLEVLWSMGIYPDVKMLQVPKWPLGPESRAHNRLRRRLGVVPDSKADARLEVAMREQLTYWGDGVLGLLDRSPLELAIVHWPPRR